MAKCVPNGLKKYIGKYCVRGRGDIWLQYINSYKKREEKYVETLKCSRVGKVKWTEKIRNDEVLSRLIVEGRNVMMMIKMMKHLGLTMYHV